MATKNRFTLTIADTDDGGVVVDTRYDGPFTTKSPSVLFGQSLTRQAQAIAGEYADNQTEYFQVGGNTITYTQDMPGLSDEQLDALAPFFHGISFTMPATGYKSPYSFGGLI